MKIMRNSNLAHRITFAENVSVRNFPFTLRLLIYDLGSTPAPYLECLVVVDNRVMYVEQLIKQLELRATRV